MAKQKAKSGKKLGKIIVILLLAIVVGVANYFINFYRGIINQYLGDNSLPGEVLNPEEGDSVVQSVAEEGFVLLKNENNALPLKKSVTKLNLFGWASTDEGMLMCGGGSGDFTMKGTNGVQKDIVYLQEALEGLEELHDHEGIECDGNCSFEINTELVNFYESYCTVNRNGGTDSRPGWFNYSGDPKYFNLVEPDISSYPADLLSNAEEFSDTALVVISRTGGESLDLPKYQRKYIPRSGQPESATSGTVTTDETRTYLELSTEEEGLLNYVKGAYANVIVILNTSATIEAGFLEDDDIDGAIYIGTPGQSGTVSLGNILRGNVSPSGKLVDTYAYDLTTAASWANSPNANVVNSATGEKTYTNGGEKYIDYQEGIYVGYKWYETANTEGYWNNVSNEYGNGYEGVVQYPFGYGLSYTNFSWLVKSVSPSNLSNITDETEIEIKIDVRNEGNVKGKDVVEVYYEPPYKSGSIEKSSSNLVAFAKTEELEPGQVQTLTLKFTADDMKSYDYSDANNNGHAGYELEKGDYLIKLSTDCHNVKSDISGLGTDKGVITYSVASDIKITEDKVTGYTVENRFTGDEADGGVSIDGSNINANITYLTRADFVGTFPQESTERREKNSKIHANGWLSNAKDTDEMPIQGEDSGLRLVNNMGSSDAEYNVELINFYGDPENYDDVEWEVLLDQITVAELENIVMKGGYATWEIPSVGKPKVVDLDGPTGFNRHPNGAPEFTGFPSAIIVAGTWNTNVAEYYGQVVGTEGSQAGVGGWYAPGMNIHRSPFCGRNYEYYSEDPFISGMIGAAVVKGTLEKGVYSYIKHFAVNENENGREGLYTWLTEQTLREVYLRPFELSIKVGKANAIMSSYNRIGDTWAGGSHALMTEILRNEWGFKGAAVTDYVDNSSRNNYMGVDQGIRAGNDIWLENGNDASKSSMNYNDRTSATAVACARDVAKHVIYMYCNTLSTSWAAGNEVGDVIQAEDKIQLWEYVWYGADIVIGGLLLLWLVCVIAKKPVLEEVDTKKGSNSNKKTSKKNSNKKR